MDVNDICLAFRFRNEDDNINRFVNNNLKYCSCFVALDDRSDNTSVFKTLFKHEKCAGIIRKNKHTDMFDGYDKECLFSVAKSTQKTWLLSVDIDEIIDSNFETEIESIPECTGCVMFEFLYMYPDVLDYITEGIYASRSFPCLFKLDRNFCHRAVPESRLHPCRFPEFDLKNNRVDLEHYRPYYYAKSKIYHYSMSSKEKREQRFAFYSHYDGDGTYQKSYNHILQKFKYSPITPNIKG